MLTSADFADVIDPQLLINLTGGTSSPDEGVITKTSVRAWGEMWCFLRNRYTEPATVPAGECKALLLTVSTFYLYAMRPELLAAPEGQAVAQMKADAMKLCEKAGKGDYLISGLTLLTADELEDEGVGLNYYSNDVVYGPTTYRGF